MFFILDTAERLGFTQVMAEIEPQSPQGRKLKKEIKPFMPGEEDEFSRMSFRLESWLKIVRYTNIYNDIKPLLAELKNIDGIIQRLSDGMALDESEMFSIKANLVLTRKIWNRLEMIPALLKINQIDEELIPTDPIFKIRPLDQLWELLNPGQVESERFYVRDEYDSKLARVRQNRDELQRKKRQLRQESLQELEEKLGWTIPFNNELAVSTGDEELLTYLLARTDLRLERETFSVYYFRWTPGEAILRIEEEIKVLEDQEEVITERVLDDLSKRTVHYAEQLTDNQIYLGELDWMLAKAHFALQHNCIPARLMEDNAIMIAKGRHLLVEAEVKSRGNEYTPIDISIKNGVTVITGSNMGGKTINLRMVGLLVAMAQYGLYVPAWRMNFSLRKFIYLSIDDDQTKGDLSTFGQEIVGLNKALPLRDGEGLMLIDELARGTNPEEGGALGKAIIKYLLDSPTVTILTTHFTALTTVSGIRHFKVIGLNQDRYELLQSKYDALEAETSLEIINQLMDYRLMEVGTGEEVTRDALRVASLLGLDEQIIQDAVDELNANA